MDPSVALDESEVRAFLGGTSDWGVETTEAGIDDLLYGGDSPAEDE